MSSTVSIYDVAKAVGVSISTVSRVMNGKAEKGRIAPSTQSRIRAAATQLGYQPNVIARDVALGRGVPRRTGAPPALQPANLSGGNTGSVSATPVKRQIGLCISTSTPAASLTLIASVAQVITEAGYELVVYTMPGEPGRIRESVVQFVEGKGAGVLCCPTVYSAILAASENKCPVIVLWQGAGKAMLAEIKLRTDGRTEHPGNTAPASRPAPPPTPVVAGIPVLSSPLPKAMPVKPIPESREDMVPGY